MASADKHNYAGHGGPVVFTDTPEYKAKPHKRRRRAKTLAKGGMYFGEKDRQFLQWVAAFGWLGSEEISRLMATTDNAVRMRSVRLVRHKLVTKFIGPGQRIVYIATSKGLRLAGLKGFKSDITPKTSTMEHTKAMVAGVLMLRDRFPQRPVVTERELFAAIKSGELTARITDEFPWVADYGTNYENWQPVFQDSESGSRKRPDLLILWRDQNQKVQPPIPVEVELTVKYDQVTYKRWMLAYENSAANGDLAPGLMFLTDEASDVKEALERAFTRLNDDNRDPISGKTPWSRLDVRIDSLGDYFTSYRRAWGVYVPPSDSDDE